MHARILLVALVLTAALAAPARGGELIGTCDSDLCAATESGKVKRLSTDGASNPYSSVSASADGKQITYVRADGLYRAGTRNARPERLFETDSGRESAISRDGASFVFRTFDSYVGAGGYTLESVLRVGGDAGSRRYSSTSEVHLGGWLGSQLAITRSEADHAIACTVALVPDDSPPPCAQRVAVDPGRDVQDFDASGDGRQLVAATTVPSNSSASDPSQVVLFDTATGAVARRLTSGPDDYGPIFSPDGKRIAFGRGADTYVVRAAGGTPAVLARGMNVGGWYATRGRAGVAKVRLRGRKAAVTVRCRADGGCRRTRLSFRKGKKRFKLRVAALKAGAKRTLKVRVPKGVGKGAKLTVTGGVKKQKIRLK